MRLICLHPGASWSVSDIYDGLTAALEKEHLVYRYNLDMRIAMARKWFDMLYRFHKRSGNDTIKKATTSDELFHAGNEALIRALYIGADWVLIISAMYVMKQTILLMKKAGLKVAVLFTESPYNDEQQQRIAEHADVCWTNERASVGRLRIWNPNTYYLRHAYDPERHREKHEGDKNMRAHDVVFVGTGFQERIDILSGVNWDGIDFGLYGAWATLGSRHRLRKHICGKETDNSETAELYRKAQIGLNLYRTSRGFGKHSSHIDRADSMSPRAYELAACGLFHLSEYRPEMRETFGELVPLFQTPKGLEVLIREWLPKKARREKIAAQLPQAVAGHNWEARAQQVTEGLIRFDKGAVKVAV